MRKIYGQIVASTIFSMKNGLFREIWKTMTIIFLSANFMLMLLSLWLLIDTFLFHGITDFLSFKFFENNSFNLYLNIVVYFFLPALIINIFYLSSETKMSVYVEDYKNSYNNRMFLFLTILSFVLSYICLMLNLFN